MHKARETMKSSEQNPMDGNVQFDKFVIGVMIVKSNRL